MALSQQQTEYVVEGGKPYINYTCHECDNTTLFQFAGAGEYVCPICKTRFFVIQESVKLGKYYRRKSFSQIKGLAKKLFKKK